MQPAAPSDPRIGMVLQDRYRIVRKLGDGGMGSVYEGEHVMIKRRVAIKVLHAQFAQNPEIVARFQREAEAATSIGHPNIIEVTDMGRFPDGTAYMVLEFLEGRDWSKDIEAQGPQPVGKVIHILTQVCDALTAAHQKGIVHRDLKPENIYLIERNGDPNFAKVLDFGISKIADGQAENRSLTQTGTALGTPYYMAPEQCQGKKDIDPRADIYSLGVILFQALTAQYPFDDESYPMLVLKICTEPPPALTHYRPDVPPELQQVVQRMLAKDRSHRFQSCAEVKAALAPFAHLHEAPVVAENAPRTSARGPSVLSGSGAGPAMTPTGTAYLPNTPAPGSLPGATPYPAQASQGGGGKGMLFAVVGLIGALVVAGALVGTLVAVGVFDGGGEEVVEVEPGTPSDPAPGAAAAGRPSTAVQTPAETVHVVIRTAPANATLYFDGERSSNPFEADIPRGEHQLRVEAEGYVTREETVAFRFDNQRVTVELQSEDAGEEAAPQEAIQVEEVAERPRPRSGPSPRREPQARAPRPEVRPLGGDSTPSAVTTTPEPHPASQGARPAGGGGSRDSRADDIFGPGGRGGGSGGGGSTTGGGGGSTGGNSRIIDREILFGGGR